MFVNLFHSTSANITPVVVPSTLLDDYPGALAAFSTYKLSASYSGFATKARKNSNGIEQDIPYSLNVLSASSFNAFIGSNDSGYATTLYNQASATNLTQAIQLSQPLISIAGYNGVPTFSFDGSNDSLTAATNFGVGTNNFTIFLVVDVPTNTRGCFLKVGNSISGFGIGVGGGTFDSNGQDLVVLFENRAWIPSGLSVAGKKLVTINIANGNTTSYDAYINKTKIIKTTGTTMIAPSSNIALGGYTTGVNNRYFNGLIPTCLIYPSQSDANIAAIQDKLIAGYSIT